MEFPKNASSEISEISVAQYAPKKCPKCNSGNLIIRSSYKRTISELGNIDTKKIIKLQVATFKCGDCGFVFVPEHPDYPKKYEYSRRVIQTALSLHFKKNLSGNKIAEYLGEYFNVNVPPKTIYNWINVLTEDFMKSEFRNDPEEALDAYKALTIDATYFNLGKGMIGKKNDVQSLSAVKLSKGIYLLTWWE